MGEITGRQVFAGTAGAFAVIIGVNLVMAYKAVSTFPGLEVKNSYVASQEFDRRRAAQQALGWTVAPNYEAGRLAIAVSGPDGHPAKLEGFAVQVGRTTERQHDVEPEFIYEAGHFVAPIELARGRWELRVKARAEDGTPFEQRLILTVKG
ncbi:FixH family protein [Vannielia litorea]|uniref:FixH family protein n=1 Tax=Vannielia litorea TaxID=1217970 RepID=UPI001C9639E2|nr:FixH family protein [Vannielia litorea]MBY6049108.1 FixH family protein [Vannielia litorea]MBY6076522.1 FixH family protein [Vannielia litorea]